MGRGCTLLHGQNTVRIGYLRLLITSFHATHFCWLHQTYLLTLFSKSPLISVKNLKIFSFPKVLGTPQFPIRCVALFGKFIGAWGWSFISI